MPKIFFTSDHHFDHANIIKYCHRPFDSVEHMNEEMVKRWNERISDEDLVFYLGDFSLSFAAVQKYLPRLKGEKHLISGNHDKTHPCHKAKAKKYHKLYLECGFSSVTHENMLRTNEELFLLHHLPYRNANIDERFLNYYPEDNGLWLLHGHVHTHWNIKGHMINVGVDMWDFLEKELQAQGFLSQNINAVQYTQSHQ